MTSTTCFHCAEPVPPEVALTVNYRGDPQAVCCAGCQAVAELIVGSGQGDYYRYREGAAQRPDPATLDRLEQWQAFDQIAPGADLAELNLLIEGIHCGACVWLIEHQLCRLDGVESIQVQQQTGQAVLRWHPAKLPLSRVLQQLARLGYRPHPVDQSGAAQLCRDERNDLLKRLAVAGLGMMQVMMYAIGTYFGVDRGMDPSIERLLFAVAMLIATPVVFYAGAPFFVAAWRSLGSGRPGMDLPITLALLLAYSASCINFFRGSGPMYFESATMFVFLLLASRFVAMRVRHQAIDAQLALTPMLPDVAIRIRGAEATPVPRQTLRDDDVIRVRAGDAFAADGEVVSGRTAVDEALLSGESDPCPKEIGDQVLAGSINIDQAVDVRVTAIHSATRIAQMGALISHARQQRPQRVELASRVASYFVAGVITVAALVLAAWLPFDPARALNATLAVLVVTCPCALALAIPTALSAAATRLARDGLLLTRLDALEPLADIDMVLFDKTGTLTRGQAAIGATTVNLDHPNPLSERALLRLIAGLEAHSNHPLARAFAAQPAAPASAVKVVPGCGLTGRIGDRDLTVGSAAFVGTAERGATIYAADQHGQLGQVDLTDRWREDAGQLIRQLSAGGIVCRVASGDSQRKVDQAVTELRLDGGIGALSPTDKLADLAAYQATGRTVLAVGDGVNDSALLAAADASVAIASGADLAKAGADVVLTGQRLAPLLQLLSTAQQVRRIVRENLAWAVGYNLLAIPLAATGLIGPGLAALGMSISSLVVVLNAARLARPPAAPKHGPRQTPRTTTPVTAS